MLGEILQLRSLARPNLWDEISPQEGSELSPTLQEDTVLHLHQTSSGIEITKLHN